MSKSGNSRAGSGELSTIIGADASLEGRLHVKHSMRVDGKVKGELVSSETIAIGVNGTVEGDISGKDIVIGGKIVGKVTASGKVVLEATASLEGDLKTAKLVVEEGAVFEGSSQMNDARAGKQEPRVYPPVKINLDN